jgi:hypothetical protein
MIELGGKWPTLMDKAGDLVIKNLDFPGAEEMAQRIAPPGADDDEDMVQTPGGPVPKQQAGQMIGQLDQTVQEMMKHIEELESGLAKSAMDNASREKIAAENNQAKLDLEELKGMVQLVLAGQQPMIAHQAAVVAAADPDHPDAPATVAQGVEQAPAEVAASEQSHQQGLEAAKAKPAAQGTSR